MATRSNIGILNSNNSVTSIYCHWDGYPEHNGRILSEHYNTDEKICELLALGNLSILGEELGVQRPFLNPFNFHSDFENYELWEKKHEHMCLAYGRDRGEEDTDANWFENVETWLKEVGEAYNYLWNGNEWLVQAQYHDNKNMMTLVEFNQMVERERAEES